MTFAFGPRRGVSIDVVQDRVVPPPSFDAHAVAQLEAFDDIYRAACAVLYNYVPLSGHPGGSISSGRFVQALLFDAMDYDLADPDREDADIISYAAGHKALGLYSLWALRDELARLASPRLLPADVRNRLRLEDLLGFRRNPVTRTPLFLSLAVKALDGHPTPATPFVRLSTGASGVGVASSIGLAWAAADLYGPDAPRVHIVEGDGGLTPGRVAEALAAAGTAGLGNLFLHVDWNQASIDSNKVCRDGAEPGDYVQWDPRELAWQHDWNVVYVPDGTDFRQIAAAQHAALGLANGQPTAIVYRTTKGWRYGIEGRASHGAGHKLCSDGFYQAAASLPKAAAGLPHCEPGKQRCRAGEDSCMIETCYWEAIQLLRAALTDRPEMVGALSARLERSRERLDGAARRRREDAPNIDAVYQLAQAVARDPGHAPAETVPAPGSKSTLRDALSKALRTYNQASGGSVLVAAADLLGSTSLDGIAEGFNRFAPGHSPVRDSVPVSGPSAAKPSVELFPPGFFHTKANPRSRRLSIGGICEDAMAGALSGISSFGHHIGVGSSYGAFLAPLGHIAARLHAIGNQAAADHGGRPYRPFILVCAHAGPKTGEDGPTHADPQALQLLQGNFPDKAMITLTPWEPRELWPLLGAALARRPSVIAPFVTRPPELVLDRRDLGLAPASDSVKGLYKLWSARGPARAGVVLQGSGVAYAFVQTALPLLVREGVHVDVWYVSSAELFDALPADERARIFPEEASRSVMGITDFTLATLDRWVRSDRGRDASLHPFRHGRFLGSGQAASVLAEAGLDGESQFEAIRAFAKT